MAKFSVQRGSTSQIIRVYIQDTSKIDGSGLTGLTSVSSGLACSYTRTGDATTATAVALTGTGTLGTYTSGFFLEVDSTGAPGEYEVHLPNAIFGGSGGTSRLYLRGATNMAVTVSEFQVDAVNYQSSTQFVASVNSVASPVSLSVADSLVQRSGTAQAGGSSTITLDAGASGNDDSYKGHVLTVISGTGSIASRQVIGYVGTTKVATVNRPWSTVPDNTSVFAIYKLIGPIVPADGSVTVGTVNDKSGYSLTQAFPSNFGSLGISAGGKVNGVALVDIITTYTGNTPQTGDNYARMGAPIGASLSADIQTRASSAQIPTSFTSALFVSPGVFSVSSLANAPTGGSAPTTSAITTAVVAGMASAPIGSVTGAVGSVTSPVTASSVTDKTGYSLTQTFPSNFSTLGISAAGKINEVILTDTLTTYSGNTPQTGDNFVRLGAPTGASIAADVQTRASSAQIPANFTTSTFVSAGVFSTASLANAPTSGSAPTVVQIRTEMDANSTKLANLDAAITTRTSLAQILNAPRDVSSVADNALTVNDAFHAAIAEMAGQEVIAGTVDTKKTPAGTVVRVFTLNSATTPTQRV